MTKREKKRRQHENKWHLWKLESGDTLQHLSPCAPSEFDLNDKFTWTSIAICTTKLKYFCLKNLSTQLFFRFINRRATREGERKNRTSIIIRFIAWPPGEHIFCLHQVKCTLGKNRFHMKIWVPAGDQSID